MKPPDADRYAYPPRGLDRDSAARYLGITPTAFDDAVRFGTLPRPRRLSGTPVWDRLALEAAFEAVPLENGKDLKRAPAVKNEPHPNVYTPQTLAARWNVSVAAIRNMIERGDLPAFRPGGKIIRISPAAVAAHESGQSAAGVDPDDEDRVVVL